MTLDLLTSQMFHRAFSSAGGMAKAGPMPMSLGSTPTSEDQGQQMTDLSTDREMTEFFRPPFRTQLQV